MTIKTPIITPVNWPSSCFSSSAYLIIIFFIICCSGSGYAEPNREFIDGIGQRGTISEEPQTVAIIHSDSLAQIMGALGVNDQIRAIGRMKEYPGRVSMNEVKLINPMYDYLPRVYDSNGHLDDMMLMVVHPDFVIWETNTKVSAPGEPPIYKKTIEHIEKNLKIPVIQIDPVALNNTDDTPELYTSLQMTGEIFHREERAREVITIIKNRNDEIDTMIPISSMNKDAPNRRMIDVNFPIKRIHEAKQHYPTEMKNIDTRNWSLAYLQEIYSISTRDASILYDEIMQNNFSVQ